MKMIKARYNKRNLTFAICMAWISAGRWSEVMRKTADYYKEGKINNQQLDILNYRCNMHAIMDRYAFPHNILRTDLYEIHTKCKGCKNCEESQKTKD